jgi:pheromone shutdown protein TraB
VAGKPTHEQAGGKSHRLRIFILPLLSIYLYINHQITGFNINGILLSDVCPNFKDLNAFNRVDDNLIIIGEAHGYLESKDLIERVINNFDIDCLALEMHNSVSLRLCSSDDGMKFAYNYAKKNSLPVYFVDKSDVWLEKETGIDHNKLALFVNKPQCSVMDNGDISMEVISRARSRVREEFNDEVYEALFTKREELMSRRISNIREENSGLVLCVVGLFHVKEMAERLRTEDYDDKSLEGSILCHTHSDS